MLLLLEKAYLWYETIKNKIKKSKNGKIIIMVSISVDSLTSLRILVGLFQSDVIEYEIIPVQNFDEGDKEIINCEKDKDDIKGFVFINCVGGIDLTKYWFCQDINIITLVTESKRPIHHLNIRSKSKIVIIEDGMNNIEYCPTQDEMNLVTQKYISIEDKKNGEKKEDDGENFYKVPDKNNDHEKNEDEPNEEEEGENEESQNENGGKDKKNKKIIKKRTDIEDSDFDEIQNESEGKDGDPLDEIADEVSVKKSKKSLYDDNDEKGENEEMEENEERKKINEKVNDFNEIHAKINEYYGGNYYGLPSTFIFYSIAHQLHKENISYLWYLIISLTDEYLRYHISDKIYNKLYSQCQQEVLRIEKKKNKR